MNFFRSVQSRISEMSKEAKGRCWDGYEPVPGKEPYSPDSCRPVGGKKPKDKKKEDKKKKAMMSCSQKAASALRLLGHAARKGSLLGGGKGLPAGVVGNLFPGQSAKFSTRELERLLPLIESAKRKKLPAGVIGNLFPGQKPIS